MTYSFLSEMIRIFSELLQQMNQVMNYVMLKALVYLCFAQTYFTEIYN